jgi:hypothetical protein
MSTRNGKYLCWIPVERLYETFAVYVDVTDTCNMVAFQFGWIEIGTSRPSRSCNIKARILLNGKVEYH